MILLFTRPKHFSLFSWVVRRIEKSEFSHVAVMVYNRSARTNEVIHSNRYRVHSESESNFLKKNEVITRIDLSSYLNEYQKLFFYRFAIESYGTAYGYLTVFGMLIARIFKTKNIFADNNKTMVCSEFIAKATLINEIDSEVDGPKTIYDKLIEKGLKDA